MLLRGIKMSSWINTGNYKLSTDTARNVSISFSECEVNIVKRSRVEKYPAV